MATPRRPSMTQEQFFAYFDHDEVTADVVSKILKNHPNRSLRIDYVYYLNPTGLAQDATNYYVISLKNGATVISSWSTLTGAQGSIAADTWVTLVNSVTDADLVLAAGDTLSLSLDETGTQTLPPGRVCVYGRFI